MKISKSKCNRKKNSFNFDSIKNSFWVYKVSGITILFPNFHKKLLSGFWKKAHFTSPPIWKFLSPNVTANPAPKNPINFVSVQNSFWVHKVTGIRCYSQDFTKKLSSIFGKCIQYVRIDFYRKKPSKPLQNTLFYALVKIICGGKPLITTNKLAGPVGKRGFWMGYIGCEMHEKPQKK